MYLSDINKIEELISIFNFTPENLYADNELNMEINCFLFLESTEQKILATGKYSISDILYGKYYWFTKFIVRYEKIYGKNSGMRQRQFKIIEEIEYADAMDYIMLEKIEHDLGYHD